MPQSQEKTPEQTELPNPELNPLLNPTLGRHLGRWAQVYFTSPPEKREEAVENFCANCRASLRSRGKRSRDRARRAAPCGNNCRLKQFVSLRLCPTLPSLECAECGHPYTSPQRFCGMCGATLEGERAPGTATVPQHQMTRPVEPLFAHADLPSLSPVSESVNPADDNYSDIRWLREKGLSDSGSPWRRRVTLRQSSRSLAIGILFYAQSRSAKAPGQPAATTCRIPRRAQNRRCRLQSPALLNMLPSRNCGTTALRSP